jgi:hypothetical protein
MNINKLQLVKLLVLFHLLQIIRLWLGFEFGINALKVDYGKPLSEEYGKKESRRTKTFLHTPIHYSCSSFDIRYSFLYRNYPMLDRILDFTS